MMPSLNRYSDVGLLILRVVVGAIFIYHGLLKWQIAEPNAIMTILKFAEPLGGLALILGALTQLASLGLSIIMIGAIYMKMTGFGQGPFNPSGTFAPQGATGWEFDLMILAGCIVLLIMGAGRLSIDSMIWKKTV